MQKEIESWQKGEKYYKGPYQQWLGYTDLQESSIGIGEGWAGSANIGESLREGLQVEESIAEGSQVEEGGDIDWEKS